MHAYPSSDGGLSICSRDITERKRAQEQVAYHASLVENMEDAVVATDERFVVTAWNPGAEMLFGRSADEALGRHVKDVIQTGLSDAERDERLRRLPRSGRARTEVIAYRKDGTPVDVEYVSVAIQEQRGEITGYLAIRRDIRERKRAEQALRAAQRRSDAARRSRRASPTRLPPSIPSGA